jgi:shikimate kinase
MPENIILIGCMGTGKSAIARTLSKRYKYIFLDTDKEVEKEAGKSISSIFKDGGEPAFRTYESTVCQSLPQKENCVIATGGGIVLNPHNQELLRSSGTVFCLSASVDTIYKRVRHTKHRPLLETGDKKKTIAELLQKRNPLYASCAHFTVSTNGQNISDVASEIWRIFSEKRV